MTEEPKLPQSDMPAPELGSSSLLVAFGELPLGTRIRYPGGEKIWTIIGQHREIDDGPMHGTLAEWQPGMIRRGRWLGQSVCSHIPEECGGDCPALVLPID